MVEPVGLEPTIPKDTVLQTAGLTNSPTSPRTLTNRMYDISVPITWCGSHSLKLGGQCWVRTNVGDCSTAG